MVLFLRLSFKKIVVLINSANFSVIQVSEIYGDIQLEGFFRG